MGNGSTSIGRVVSVVVCAVALAACASAKATAGVTAADVAVPKESLKTTQTVKEAGAEPPPGRLVCRTKSSTDGTTELFVEEGKETRGTLRKRAPSGELYAQNLRVERVNGVLIADDPSSKDLVVHAATVRSDGGKKYIRLGDWREPWSLCE